MRAIAAGTVYFLLVYAAGWALGPIRQIFVAPRIGATAAVLLEAPLMLAASLAASSWVVRRFALPPRLGARLAAGLVALVLLLLAEAAAARFLRGLAVADYLAGFGSLRGAISLALFLLFAATPVLIERGR